MDKNHYTFNPHLITALKKQKELKDNKLMEGIRIVQPVFILGL